MYFDIEQGLMVGDNGDTYEVDFNTGKVLAPPGELTTAMQAAYDQGVANGEIPPPPNSSEPPPTNTDAPAPPPAPPAPPSTDGNPVGEDTNGGGVFDGFDDLVDKQTDAISMARGRASHAVPAARDVNTALNSGGTTSSVAASDTESEAQKNSNVQTNQENTSENNSELQVDGTQKIDESITGTSNTGTKGKQFTDNVANTSATVAREGTANTKVTDDLGFGDALAGTLDDAALADSSKSNALTDLINNGGVDSGFQDRMTTAIKGAQSGPAMAMAGQSANDRIASRAAAEVGQQSIQNMLSATSQVGGPTATATAAQVGQGFTGREQSTVDSERNAQKTQETGIVTSDERTNQATGQNRDSTVTNSETQVGSGSGTETIASTVAGTEDTKANQSSLATTLGQMFGWSFGVQPEGGKVICTAMCQAYGFGGFRTAIWVRYALKNLTPEHQIGYHRIVIPLINYAYQENPPRFARWLRRHGEALARRRTADIREQSRGLCSSRLVRLERLFFENMCYLVGRLTVRSNKLTERKGEI